MVQLLKDSYSVKRNGDIIFVCGGNGQQTMREKFRAHCLQNCPEFQIFFPEYAMQDYFEGGVVQSFDIADFEMLVASISHAIIIFPEAPGSFAETGYFSLQPQAAEKVLLALDSQYQRETSFISLGPAKKIAQATKFNHVLQTDYNNPDFDTIVRRIKSVPFSKNRKALKLEKFSDLDDYTLFCLIHECFYLLAVATFEDIIFVMRSLYNAHISVNKVKQLTSILVGAKYLRSVGQYGHYILRKDLPRLLLPREGKQKDNAELLTEIALVLENADDEFSILLQGARNAVG